MLDSTPQEQGTHGESLPINPDTVRIGGEDSEAPEVDASTGSFTVRVPPSASSPSGIEKENGEEVIPFASEKSHGLEFEGSAGEENIGDGNADEKGKRDHTWGQAQIGRIDSGLENSGKPHWSNRTRAQDGPLEEDTNNWNEDLGYVTHWNAEDSVIEDGYGHRSGVQNDGEASHKQEETLIHDNANNDEEWDEDVESALRYTQPTALPRSINSELWKSLPWSTFKREFALDYELSHGADLESGLPEEVKEDLNQCEDFISYLRAKEVDTTNHGVQPPFVADSISASSKRMKYQLDNMKRI